MSIELPVRIGSFPFEGNLRVSLGMGFSMKIKRFSLESLDAFITPRMELTGELLNLSLSASVKNDYQLFSIPHAAIPIGPVVIVPKIVVYAHVDCEGKISLSSEIVVSQHAKYGIRYSDEKWDPYCEAGAGVASFEINSTFSVGGKVGVGLKLSELFSFYGTNTGVGLSLIAKDVAKANFSLEANDSTDGSFYAAAKNSKIWVGAVLGGDVFVMAKLFRKTLAKYSVATPEMEFPVYEKYILPHFDSYALADNSSDRTKATLSYHVSNDIVMAAEVGIALFDWEGQRVQTKYHASKHKDALPGVNYKFDFTGLDAGRGYVAKPVVRYFGAIEVVADLTIELEGGEGDLIWATSNVGASTPEGYGGYYTFDEAQTVCPAGWRPPTYEEFYELCYSEKITREPVGITGNTDEFGNLIFSGFKFTYKATGVSVFLPAAGYRSYSSGTPYTQGASGYYWSSTPTSGASGYYLYFYSGYVYPSGYNYRSDGFSVRCVRPK